MSSRQQRGHLWEQAAAEYLERRGLEVLERRYRCRLGELDLVCRDHDALVVVEVRARATGAVASALETVDRHKQRRIVQATRHLLMRRPQWSTLALRFDVVAIDGIDGRQPSLRWVVNAFDCG